MPWRSLASHRRRALILLGLALLVAGVAGWTTGAGQRARAADSASPDLSIEVLGVPGCDTNQDPPAASCNAPGGTFTIVVDLNALGSLQDNDNDGKAGYGGTQVRLNYSGGLTVRTSRMLGLWPDCAITAADSTPGSLLLGCNIAIGANESLYVGPIFEVDFDCPSEPGTGQVGMVHGGRLDSGIVDETYFLRADKDPSPETLDVNCTEPPPPPEPTNPGAMAVDCDTGQTGVQSHCSYAPGSIFGVQMHVTKAPTSGYVGFSTRWLWDNPALQYLPAADPASEALWPFCDVAARTAPVLPNSFFFACASNALPAGDSTTGAVLQVTFRCASEGEAWLDLVTGSRETRFNIGSGGLTIPAVSGARVACGPPVPFNLKLPALQNLFLTAQGAKLPPATCDASTNTATFTHELSRAPTSADPKDPSAVQQVGGFEMEVRFDEKLVCVNLEAGAYFEGTAGAVCFIDDKDQGLRPEGLARIGCVIKGKPTAVSSSLELARVIVRPQPELYSQIIANQDNGVVAQILNQDCNLADMQGHPIQKIGCDDSELTIRFLEGDVNGDCSVDVADQQLLAFRWGAEFGSQLYNPRFDLEPSGQIKGDGDLDIKDVQFVFGRHGSTCAAPHPDQPPLNGKLANP